MSAVLRLTKEKRRNSPIVSISQRAFATTAALPSLRLGRSSGRGRPSRQQARYGVDHGPALCRQDGLLLPKGNGGSAPLGDLVDTVTRSVAAPAPAAWRCWPQCAALVAGLLGSVTAWRGPKPWRRQTKPSIKSPDCCRIQSFMWQGTRLDHPFARWRDDFRKQNRLFGIDTDLHGAALLPCPIQILRECGMPAERKSRHRILAVR
jgi:hypothetical protein